MIEQDLSGHIFYVNGVKVHHPFTVADVWLPSHQHMAHDKKAYLFIVTRGKVARVRLPPMQVFIRGGNYIASDMLLRTSEQRYCDEVRMHAEVLQPIHVRNHIPAIACSSGKSPGPGAGDLLPTRALLLLLCLASDMLQVPSHFWPHSWCRSCEQVRLLRRWGST